MYGNEREVGRAVRDSGVPREQVFLTTKLPPGAAGRERRTLDSSLRALGMTMVEVPAHTSHASSQASISQRPAALGPQLLDLVKMLPDVGSFLRRDAPPMRQAPLHRPLGGTLAVPGSPSTATPAERGAAGGCGCGAATAFIQMAFMLPLEASLLYRSADSNARCPLRSPGWMTSMDTRARALARRSVTALRYLHLMHVTGVWD
jgi:hypothetical protein